MPINKIETHFNKPKAFDAVVESPKTTEGGPPKIITTLAREDIVGPAVMIAIPVPGLTDMTEETVTAVMPLRLLINAVVCAAAEHGLQNYLSPPASGAMTKVGE